MTLRLYRLSKRLTMAVAALPLFQAAGGCDLIGFDSAIGQEFTQNLVFGMFSTVVRGVQTTLLTFFPSANLLQLLLGGNTTQFFTG